MVVLIWVASALLIHIIFTSKDTEFPKPLFLTYYCTAWFTLYLVPMLYDWVRLKRAMHRAQHTPEEPTSPSLAYRTNHSDMLTEAPVSQSALLLPKSPAKEYE